MSMTSQLSAGLTFGYAAANVTGTTSASYTLLGKIADFTPPKEKTAKVSDDTFDCATNSAGLPVEAFIPGWESPGNAVVKLKFDSGGTQRAVLYGLKNVLHTYAYFARDGHGRYFNAYMLEFGDETPLKDSVMVDCTVELSGPATLF